MVYIAKVSWCRKQFQGHPAGARFEGSHLHRARGACWTFYAGDAHYEVARVYEPWEEYSWAATGPSGYGDPPVPLEVLKRVIVQARIRGIELGGPFVDFTPPLEIG